MKTTRRAFVAGLSAAPLSQAASSKPNVLLFLTDQESTLLPGPVTRPAHDALRAQGAEFTRAFCNTPQCSPARASLLTGLEPHHAGVLTNVDPTSVGKPLMSSIPTIGNVFANAGYRTAYFGKWHLGTEEAPSREFGFADTGGGTDTAVAAKAAAWIARQTEPWFVIVSVLNPHDIYNIVREAKSVAIRPGVRSPMTKLSDLAARPPAQMQYMNSDQGRPMLNYDSSDWLRYRSYYCSLVERADQCLATVLAAVSKLAETVVAYSSDHGDALGEHGLPFKGPFLYEPLVRIPLVISGPGIRPGSVRHELITTADIAPSLAALAGIRWPQAIDGKDFSKNGGREDVYLEYFGKQHWITPIRTLRTNRWKLSHYSSGRSELYDIASDPIEAHDLADDPGKKNLRADLEKRLDKWWAGSNRATE